MGRVFIGVGHGGTDPGAVGYLTEKDINLKMAQACRDYLAQRGIETQMSRTGDTDDQLSAKIARCNAYAPDLALDIHNNAGGGDGFEILHSITGGTGKKLAENIEREVIRIGQNSRGLKTRKNARGTDYFGFIRSTNCPAVICEGVFVDNKADAAQADTDAECRAFGEAYARGVLVTLGVQDTDAAKTATASTARTTGADTVTKADAAAKQTTAGTGQKTESGYRVKVTATALNIRKDAGTSHAVTGVIRDRGVYTIVAEKTVSGQTWGRLKSGAGWICLAYTKKI